MRWALLVFYGQIAYACSCVSTPSSVQAWDNAPLVFVGSVESADPVYRPGDVIVPEQTAKIKVEEPFKGVEPGTVIRLQQPGMCAPYFETGQRVLIYAEALDKRTWYVPGCGRSRLLSDAADDLLFLRALPRSATSNRVSGQVRLIEASPKLGASRVISMPGVTVTIFGADSPRRITTNSDGIFEVYGLPPGEYRVVPDIAPGMKLRSFNIEGAQNRRDEASLHLNDRSGVSVRFSLEIDTRISGRVLDPQGKPMPDVRLELEPVNGEPEEGLSAYSKKDGSYILADMPSGTYRIVANRSGEITADYPFPAIYYPGVADRLKATTVTIVSGDQRTGFDLRIPEFVPRSILAGRVQFSDGSPVPGVDVCFSSADGRHFAKTSPEGGFALMVLKGVTGEVSAELLADRVLLGQCPQWRVGSAEAVFVKANAISVSADIDQRSLLVTLPIPACEAWFKRRQ